MFYVAVDELFNVEIDDNVQIGSREVGEVGDEIMRWKWTLEAGIGCGGRII